MSLLTHLAIALVLALWVLPSDATNRLYSLLVTIAKEEPQKPVEILEIVQVESLRDINTKENIAEAPEVFNEPELAPMNIQLPPSLTAPTENELMDVTRIESTLASEAGLESLARMGELGGRTMAGKRAALTKYGGSAASEAAVKSGLEWLRRIQRRDGSWIFSRPGPGAQPGRLRRTTMGATSMALLCYLGAGHTHKTSGPYRRTVRDGLKYLLRNANKMEGGATDLRGNYEDNAGMYVQGIATICLSEAHALEPRDEDLAETVSRAVRFIEVTQHPQNGGWRYEPRQRGDTSVTGWQVMALHSARIGGIPVQRNTVRGIQAFLNSMQTNDGAQYRYASRSGHSSTSMTAVGLLCRMYMGWNRDHPALQSGVAHLSAIGPSRDDIYYNYYATQVLHHWGGEEWKKWNDVLRDQLVDSQITEGPAAGSWAPGDDESGRTAGQIFQTTMTLQTLEVYYRHLPIYRQFDEALDTSENADDANTDDAKADIDPDSEMESDTSEVDDQ